MLVGYLIHIRLDEPETLIVEVEDLGAVPDAFRVAFAAR
jgi:hypothetical protein